MMKANLETNKLARDIRNFGDFELPKSRDGDWMVMGYDGAREHKEQVVVKRENGLNGLGNPMEGKSQFPKKG